jgi:hypothetical protein
MGAGALYLCLLAALCDLPAAEMPRVRDFTVHITPSELVPKRTQVQISASTLPDLAAQVKQSLGLGGAEYGFGGRVQLLPAHEMRPVFPEEATPFESLDDIGPSAKVYVRRAPHTGPACAQLVDGARIEAEGATAILMRQREAEWREQSDTLQAEVSRLQAALDAAQQ